MVKADFLKSLDEDELKDISKKEGLVSITKNYEKDDFIKFLEGVLTSEKIKRYQREYVETEVERDIHIHEKVKEKRLKEDTTETTKITVSKHEMMINLQKAKIHKSILEPISDYLHVPNATGSGVRLYDNMNEKMLNLLHKVFIDNEPDKTGRNFEFLAGNWLAFHEKGISRIEFRHKFPTIGEIDIVGYDEYDLPYVVAECKDRSVSFEDIDKWLANSRSITEQYADNIIRKYGEVVMKAYFFGSAGYSQGVTDRVKNHNDVNNKYGAMVINRGLFKDTHEIKLKIIDVRDGKFKELYP